MRSPIFLRSASHVCFQEVKHPGNIEPVPTFSTNDIRSQSSLLEPGLFFLLYALDREGTIRL